MIGYRHTKEIYRSRIYLLALHFISRTNQLIGDIILFVTEITVIAASMCRKLPSFQWFNHCKNNVYLNLKRKSERTIILFFSIDKLIYFQQEIDIFL